MTAWWSLYGNSLYNPKAIVQVLDIHRAVRKTGEDGKTPHMRLVPSSAPLCQPSPAVMAADIDQECIAGVINTAERLLIVLDVDRMSEISSMHLLTVFVVNFLNASLVPCLLFRYTNTSACNLSHSHTCTTCLSFVEEFFF